jgi:hypothetical protein
MANAINIPKTHLIMGLSLPLAVLLGYFVAEPMELGSLAVVVFVLVVLSIPLMMKWYCPLLVLAWNASIAPAFLPSRPALWAMLAFVGLLFAVLGRAVNPDARFVIEPSITKSLLALTAVVVATGLMTGGFGVRSLGSGRYGGKHYFYFVAAVVGYFVFTSRRIPPHRAGLYVALFFLSGLSHALSELASSAGPKFDFLYLFLSPGSASTEGDPDAPLRFVPGMARMHGLTLFGAAIYGYLLARFGFRGLLDLKRPWRLLLLLSAVLAGMLSGFRSFLILSAMTFAVMFYLEGLHRTRYALGLLAVTLLGGVVVLPQAEKLPLVIQRSLSFLPGKFNWVARESASTTVEWRVTMWRDVLPEVPKCLFRGKGWGIDAGDYHSTLELGAHAISTDPLAGTILVGNFHNGPLSILIPFGLYGIIAFVWFLVAGLRVLHRNWKFGDPTLRNLNGLLLAAFAAQAVFFFGFFGGLSSDMAIFTGLLGMGVAINGAGAAPAHAEQSAVGAELNTEYIKA